MMWAVVGANGMLGTDLVAVLRSRGHDVRSLDRSEIDVTTPDGLVEAFAGASVVVNCAAHTAVDAAESEEAAAFAINGLGAANVARAAATVGARLVHISTDYVFAGDADRPYSEDAPVAPRSAYGRTKAAGEWAVGASDADALIVRTAWLYGAHGACFPRTIARVAAERGGLDVIDDQIGQPTWTVDLASLIVRLIDASAPAGVYHGTSSGEVSWHGFAQAVVAAAGQSPEIVRRTTSDAYVRPAPRPAYSVLGHEALERIGVAPIGNWRDRWTAASDDVLAGVPGVEAVRPA